MAETFEEKCRRSLVERYGVNKGNRLADERERGPALAKKRKKRAYE